MNLPCMFLVTMLLKRRCSSWCLDRLLQCRAVAEAKSHYLVFRHSYHQHYCRFQSHLVLLQQHCHYNHFLRMNLPSPADNSSILSSVDRTSRRFLHSGLTICLSLRDGAKHQLCKFSLQNGLIVHLPYARNAANANRVRLTQTFGVSRQCRWNPVPMSISNAVMGAVHGRNPCAVRG